MPAIARIGPPGSDRDGQGAGNHSWLLYRNPSASGDNVEMTKASELRELLRQDGMITAPGAYDCITARMIEQAGFSAVYMTGAGTAAALGYPDYGLVTMSEMVENAGRIAAAVNVPVIADADTGYGNELNVVRTVREYEQRGVAGIHIEDQGFPRSAGTWRTRRSFRWRIIWRRFARRWRPNAIAIF